MSSSPGAPRLRSRALFVAALALAFSFRLACGLSSDFWQEDETQIFLLGLRAHAFGGWPFYGPDVVWTQSQVPGALQALLVAAPLDALPVPEAPFVLLNLLSMAALGLLSWYLSRRLPELPRWLLWSWPLLLPWTVHYSTQVVNPSYVLPGSVVFFVGFLEAFSPTRAGLLARPLAHAMTGFGLLWVMQLHLSWVVLVPFLVLATGTRAREGVRALGGGALSTVAGALVSGSLLLPTLVLHGLAGGAGAAHRNLELHLVSPTALFAILARFLSFATMEVNRFVETTGARRVALLLHHPWLIPATLVTAMAGVVHTVLMGVLWFRRGSRHPEWTAIRWLALGTVALVYLSYFVAREEPQAHAFYVVAPLAIVYAFYSWTLVDGPRTRRLAAWVLVVAAVFHAGLFAARAPGRSLYRNRRLAALAVRTRTPWIFAHRRAYAWDARTDPARAPEAALPGDAVSDLRLLDPEWDRVHGLSIWAVTLHNTGRAAYRDLRIVCSYRDADGRPLGESPGMLAEVVQPGEIRRLPAIVDDFPAEALGAVTADLRLVSAEKLLPLTAVTGGIRLSSPRVIDNSASGP